MAKNKFLVEVTFKYRSYAYFEPIRPSIIHQALDYLKTHNKF